MDVYNPEDVEKVRQAIMRYQELLEIAKKRLSISEKTYNQLFEKLSSTQKETLQTKQQQRLIAEHLLETELAPLRQALLQTAFDLRDIYQEFEATHDHIAEEE